MNQVKVVPATPFSFGVESLLTPLGKLGMLAMPEGSEKRIWIVEG